MKNLAGRRLTCNACSASTLRGSPIGQPAGPTSNRDHAAGGPLIDNTRPLWAPGQPAKQPAGSHDCILYPYCRPAGSSIKPPGRAPCKGPILHQSFNTTHSPTTKREVETSRLLPSSSSQHSSRSNIVLCSHTSNTPAGLGVLSLRRALNLGTSCVPCVYQPRSLHPPLSLQFSPILAYLWRML